MCNVGSMRHGEHKREMIGQAPDGDTTQGKGEKGNQILEITRWETAGIYSVVASPEHSLHGPPGALVAFSLLRSAPVAVSVFRSIDVDMLGTLQPCSLSSLPPCLPIVDPLLGLGPLDSVSAASRTMEGPWAVLCTAGDALCIICLQCVLCHNGCRPNIAVMLELLPFRRPRLAVCRLSARPRYFGSPVFCLPLSRSVPGVGVFSCLAFYPHYYFLFGFHIFRVPCSSSCSLSLSLFSIYLFSHCFPGITPHLTSGALRFCCSSFAFLIVQSRTRSFLPRPFVRLAAPSPNLAYLQVPHSATRLVNTAFHTPNFSIFPRISVFSLTSLFSLIVQSTRLLPFSNLSSSSLFFFFEALLHQLTFFTDSHHPILQRHPYYGHQPLLEQRD